MRNIALFGGSFDPPHLGHEAIVKAVSKLDYIDKIIVMPTFLNPFKKSSVAPAKLRLKWLYEIFSSLHKVEISSYEVEQNRKVPTIESVEYFLKKYDKIYLVIGADNVNSLHLWHQYEKLKELVTFIVASRDSIKVPNNFIKLDIDVDVSSSLLREEINSNMLSNINAKKIEKYYKGKK